MKYLALGVAVPAYLAGMAMIIYALSGFRGCDNPRGLRSERHSWRSTTCAAVYCYAGNRL
jgi:hypothetical protein